MPNTAYHQTKYSSQNWVPTKKKKKVVESVKREAEPGEKIVIVKKHYASDFWIGDIFTVKEVNKERDVVMVEEDDQGVIGWEYEVITKME